MSIREWYGVDGKNNPNTEINSCIDGLLELYANAIKQYFSIDAKSFQTIMTIDVDKLNKGQMLFLQWLKETGFPYLRELATSKLPNDPHLISKVDYDKYILEEEMDFKFPDDVRSLLIGIVSDMPEYIAASKEISATVADREIWKSWFVEYLPLKTNESVFDFSFVDPYKLQENEYYTSNYKESANKAGSLFMLRRIIYGNLGLLQDH